jgi:hypothetical protein
MLIRFSQASRATARHLSRERRHGTPASTSIPRRTCCSRSERTVPGSKIVRRGDCLRLGAFNKGKVGSLKSCGRVGSTTRGERPVARAGRVVHCVSSRGGKVPTGPGWSRSDVRFWEVPFSIGKKTSVGHNDGLSGQAFGASGFGQTETAVPGRAESVSGSWNTMSWSLTRRRGELWAP